MNILERDGDIEFYVTDTYTLEDLRKVQARSIEIYRKVAAVLDRHDIDYTLGYGSLLGQIRHSGYIPWDDDIDLFIMSHDYGRAILHLRRELPDDLLLHDRRNDPVYWVTWVKVRDLNTLTLESMWKIDRKLKYHGVCVDLIKVVPTTEGKHRHNAPIKALTEQLRKRQSARQELRGMRSLARLPRLAATELGLGLRIAYHRLMRRQGTRKLLIAAPGTVIERSFDYDDMYPIRTDGPLFEGMKVNTPNNPEGVLRSMYGDFMALPPLEAREPHFESVRFFGEEAPEGPLDAAAPEPVSPGVDDDDESLVGDIPDGEDEWPPGQPDEAQAPTP